MITRAGPFHPPALAAIHQAAFPAGEAWDAALLAGHLSMPGVVAFIDARGGMILARVAADEAEILTIAVAPPARRQGIGRALLCEAARHAAASGASRIFLEVAETNSAANGLYTSLGFEKIGSRRHYYADHTDAHLLAAPLPLAGAICA